MTDALSPLDLDDNPDQARATYRNAILDVITQAPGPKRISSREEVYVYDTWLRIHRPQTNAFGRPPGVVVFLRGGYGMLGDRDTHDALAKRYGDLPAVVISVDLPQDAEDFAALTDRVLNAIRHADNTPLFHTTLSPEVAFVGVDVNAILALAAAMKLHDDPTLGGSLTQCWTVKGVNLIDPVVNAEEVQDDLGYGLVDAARIAQYVRSWPAGEGAQAFWTTISPAHFDLDDERPGGVDDDDAEEDTTGVPIQIPVLTSVFLLSPLCDGAITIAEALAENAMENAMSLYLGACGVDDIYAAGRYRTYQAAFQGLIQSFAALCDLPDDTVRA